MLSHIKHLLPHLGLATPNITYSTVKQLCIINNQAAYTNIVYRVQFDYYMSYLLLIQSPESLQYMTRETLSHVCRDYKIPVKICAAIYVEIVEYEFTKDEIDIVHSLIKQHPNHMNLLAERYGAAPGIYHLFPHVPINEEDSYDTVDPCEDLEEFIYLYKLGKVVLPKLTYSLSLTLDKRILVLYPDLNQRPLAYYRVHNKLTYHNPHNAGHSYLAYLQGKPLQNSYNSIGSLLGAISIANNDYTKLAEVVNRITNIEYMLEDYDTKSHHIFAMIMIIHRQIDVTSECRTDLDDCELCQEFRRRLDQ